MVFLFFNLLLLSIVPSSKVSGEAKIKPSRGWGMFFDTTGDVKIDITDPGVAVRIEIPRPFLEGTSENDTSHVRSDISDDYFYYAVIDQSLHYPYDPNSPYTVEIWNPPQYLSPSCTGFFYNFTSPKYVLLRNLIAPSISGIYNFTIYISKKMHVDHRPIFPAIPDKVLQVPVSMREDPSFIAGYISDYLTKEHIRAKGIVYAIGVTSGRIGRGYVNPATGFFNISGLYEGKYRLEGSAGYFSSIGYAYVATEYPSQLSVSKGPSGLTLSDFLLDRGCNITGRITYADQTNTPLRPLETPYLKALNYEGLNYTVEAYDAGGQIVASKTYKSRNVETESYELAVREGVKYVHYPAKGTEYAGFGPGSVGASYRLKIWVYGFTLPPEQIRTVTFSAGARGVSQNTGESTLHYGGVISGKIRLWNRLPMGGVLETPRQAEAATFGSSTGKHFGGNIVIEAFKGGALAGLVVLNRTSQNGVVQYADFSSGDQTPLLKFYVLGFSEHYNHSYSGIWAMGSYPGPSPWDYGLEPGTYSLRIWIRGYEHNTTWDRSIILAQSGNSTVTIDVARGGAAQITVSSWNTITGTRRLQAEQPWRFLDLCPPPRLRVYFHTQSMAEVGYTEAVLRLGLPGITSTLATLNFTGHNWPVDEITFQRDRFPTTLSEGMYVLKAYTVGYIQIGSASLFVNPSSLSRAGIRLVIGCEINGFVPLMMNGLFVSLTEKTAMRPQALLMWGEYAQLKGVDVVSASAGASVLNYAINGFYGRGHFFYVDEDGTRWKDYGLDVGGYSVKVPVFGYDRMFHQPISVYVYLPNLAYRVGLSFSVKRMIKISGVVTGFTFREVPVSTIALTWVNVAANGYVTRTFDGDYALHALSGSYSVTYSVPGYRSTTMTITTNDEAQNDVNLEQSATPFP
jgi:hypothetical protein